MPPSIFWSETFPATGLPLDYDAQHRLQSALSRLCTSTYIDCTPFLEGRVCMPMIDVYAAVGTFADTRRLATDLATAVMTIEQVPNIPMFRKNTAAFVHELPVDAISNVNGDNTYVRVQVLTNAGALDRDKQLAVVSQLTQIIAQAASDPAIAERTWVLLTEAPNGGWGLKGHANTNEELVAAARAEIASLAAKSPPEG